MDEQRTPEQWLQHPDYRGVRILDHDGWTRDEWGEPIGREEFQQRLNQCTQEFSTYQPGDRHETSVEYHPATGSYGWVCACGKGSGAELPNPVAESLAEAHRMRSSLRETPPVPVIQSGDIISGKPGATLAAWVEQATPDQLRAGLLRLADLAAWHGSNPPPNESLVIVGTSGGHQDLEYRERAYIRQDESGMDDRSWPRNEGDWYAVADTGDHKLTWGELNWLDDPPCDRGSVYIDGHYLHIDTIATAILGNQPNPTP